MSPGGAVATPRAPTPARDLLAAPAAGPAPGPAPRGWGTSRRAALLALVLYGAYAVLQTWPLVTDPGGLLAGGAVGRDYGASAAWFGYLAAHHLSPFAPAVLHGLDAPQGLPLGWVTDWVGAPGVALQYGLTLAVGPVAGANAFLWLAFVASAMAMFLLARRLCHHGGAAFLAGLAFGFSPFAVQQIGGHPVYAQGWVFVLAAWRLLELAARPTRRDALLAGAATALAMWFTPYFLLFGALLFGALGVAAVIAGAARGEGRLVARRWLLAAVVPGLLLVALAALVTRTSGAAAGGLQVHGINQFYAFSARPSEYLLPDRRNPVFGSLTGPFLTAHLNRSTFMETSLYLGWSVIALAAVGAVWAVGRLRRDGAVAARDPQVLAVVGGLALAAVAIAFSLPPTVGIGPLHLAMPEALVYLVTSTWRTTSRLVVVVQLGLGLALTAGAARLLAGRDRAATRALVVALAGVVGLDLWARPQTRTVSVTPPPEYAWLAHHPGGIVADYPLLPSGLNHYGELFWALSDGHPSLRGYQGGVSEAVKTGLGALRDPQTAPELAALGVRWVVVHPGQWGGGPRGMPGYRLRFASATGDVYAVTARPPRFRVDGIAALAPIEGPAGHEYRWLTARHGALLVTARDCDRCRVAVTFGSRSDAVPRTLVVSDRATGARLARVRVPVGRTATVRLAAVALHGGRAVLDLRTAAPSTQTPVARRLGTSAAITVELPRARRFG